VLPDEFPPIRPTLRPYEHEPSPMPFSPCSSSDKSRKLLGTVHIRQWVRLTPSTRKLEESKRRLPNVSWPIILGTQCRRRGSCDQSTASGWEM
jgi:hypothetical protein